MQVVVNVAPGGFGCSALLIKKLLDCDAKCLCKIDASDVHFFARNPVPELGDEYLYSYNTLFKGNYAYMVANTDEARADYDLVHLVEELGDAANNDFSKLGIIEIPDDVKFRIHERESGVEYIQELSRVWNYPGDSTNFDRL